MKTSLISAFAFSCLLAVATPYAVAVDKDSAIVSAAFKSVFYLPVYFAEEHGYFDEVGLDVRIDVASSSTNALAAVISRSADFSLHGPEWTAISAGRGAPVKVVGGTLNRLGVWLTCDPQLDYQSLDSLKGKTVSTGMMPTTSSSVFLKLLNQAGIDPKEDVDILEVPMGNEIGPLVAGGAACAVLYEPNVSQAENQGYKIVAAFAKELGPYTFSAISTREDVKPQVVKKFVTGIDRALKEIHRNPSAAVDSGLKLFPDLDPVVVEASVRRLIDDKVYADSVAIDEQGLKDAFQTQVDLGNLAAQPDTDVLLDVAAANEAAAQSY